MPEITEETTENVGIHDNGMVYVDTTITVKLDGAVIGQRHVPTREIYPNDPLDGESPKVTAIAEVAREHASQPLAVRPPLDRD